jgi:hypothetical protein
VVGGGLLLGLSLAVTLAAGCGDDDTDPPPGGGLAPAGGTSAGGSGVAGQGAVGGGAGGVGASGGEAGGTGGAAPSGGAGGQGGAGAQGGAGGLDYGATVTLLEQPGAFFTPSEGTTVLSLDFGANGTVYTAVRVEFDVLVGSWQPEIPDEGNPDRTEHILFGLFRDHQPNSYQRYLMGSAAVTFATKAPHFRMFGRTTIGQGYTTYRQWSDTYLWQSGATYHLDCLLDGITHLERCELSLDDSLENALEGAVDYLDPAAHLSSGFFIQIGKPAPGDIETSPLGWTFSNLLVTATLAL